MKTAERLGTIVLRIIANEYTALTAAEAKTVVLKARGHTYEQVGHELGIPEKLAQKTFYSALQRFKKSLASAETNRIEALRKLSCLRTENAKLLTELVRIKSGYPGTLDPQPNINIRPQYSFDQGTEKTVIEPPGATGGARQAPDRLRRFLQDVKHSTARA